jgi:hypothetical protein
LCVGVVAFACILIALHIIILGVEATGFIGHRRGPIFDYLVFLCVCHLIDILANLLLILGAVTHNLILLMIWMVYGVFFVFSTILKFVLLFWGYAQFEFAATFALTTVPLGSLSLHLYLWICVFSLYKSIKELRNSHLQEVI